MKKIVSIALFGEGEKRQIYSRYLKAFTLAHLNLFPREEDWVLRVHVDASFFRSDSADPHARFLHKLEMAGLVEVATMGPAQLTKAMLWRVAPLFDTNVAYVFCRDIDACPMPRDRAVCDAFIASGCVLHTVHDNLQHCMVMGGLCGFDAVAFRDLWTLPSNLDGFYAAAAETEAAWAKHGTDQNVLNRMLLRPGGPSLLEHRFAGWTEGKPTGQVRGPGRYLCATKSLPVPDVGVSRFRGALAAEADRLANHLGAAGFDHDAAVRFYNAHGDPKIAAQIRACED